MKFSTRRSRKVSEPTTGLKIIYRAGGSKNENSRPFFWQPIGRLTRDQMSVGCSLTECAYVLYIFWVPSRINYHRRKDIKRSAHLRVVSFSAVRPAKRSSFDDRATDKISCHLQKGVFIKKCNFPVV